MVINENHLSAQAYKSCGKNCDATSRYLTHKTHQGHNMWHVCALGTVSNSHINVNVDINIYQHWLDINKTNKINILYFILFFTQSDGKGPREEIQHIPNVVLYTSTFAFLFGGQFGRRIADDYFRRHNQLTVYESVMHAKRQYHASVAMGFVKYGGRWGWRAGLFSGVYRYHEVSYHKLIYYKRPSLVCIMIANDHR